MTAKVFLAGLAGLSGAALAFGGEIVIDEIHYHPDVKGEAVEFVELYNRGNAPMDISRWKFSAGLKYQFPTGMVMLPDHYLVLARDTNAFRRKFKISADGQYEGHLSHRGEKIALRDASGAIVDEVDYKLGFPWPTVGDAPGSSIELLNPGFDNALGGNWRASSERKGGKLVGRGPTPGARNSVFVTNAPPQLRQVSHGPKQPKSSETVRIRVKATDPDGVVSVTLQYQIVEPGKYFDLHDPAFATNWISLAMMPEGGTNQDFFSAEIPADIQKHRRLIRYRIAAADRADQKVMIPYEDDPQPDFAYFVYDGVPSWRAAIQPQSKDSPKSKVTEFDTNVMRRLPVYHLISRKDAVERATWFERRGGHDYQGAGALVYEGKVYDHIRYRARGGGWRYAMGKNMWKFDFNRGHEFEARDNYGEKYGERWKKLNLGACIQQADYGHRGEQGMFEAVGFRLFNLAGVEAPSTHWVQFRVIDEAAETRTQYEGDFWGLYLAVEQMDGKFLDEHDLPDGNLFKMEYGTGKLSNQGSAGPRDHSDLRSFMAAYQRNPDETWWRRNVDLPKYYSYRAIVEAIHHYDIDEGPGKNYFYLFNPEIRRWSVHPWDIDLTWADSMYGSGQSPFYHRVLGRPAFQLEYQNRLREIRDLLYNSEQAGQLIDEYAAIISDSAGKKSIVDADRALWDYNPVMTDSRRSMQGKAGVGHFYEAAPAHDFAGMVRLMKNYVRSRGVWIDANLLRDRAIPATPSITQKPGSSFSARSLSFQTSPFAGAGQFAAVKWRLAKVSEPLREGERRRGPLDYEITSLWESPEIATPTWEITVPPDAVRAGTTYRVRARMKDRTGRWGHWSSPIQFMVAP